MVHLERSIFRPGRKIPGKNKKKYFPFLREFVNVPGIPEIYVELLIFISL